MARPRKYPAWYRRVMLTLPPQILEALDRARDGRERSEFVTDVLARFLRVPPWDRRDGR